MSERITSQKQIILDYLRSVKTHPSAEMIYKNVKKKLPRISMGTVYRVLENFKEKGEILELPGEIKRFDGDVSPHHHFICEKCGKIIDIFEKYNFLTNKGRQNLPPQISKKFGGVKNYRIYFYGLCPTCKKKSKNYDKN